MRVGAKKRGFQIEQRNTLIKKARKQESKKKRSPL
jgi:hypothetical protein